MARKFAKPFYNSKEWKVVREYCLKRDKYLCQRCGEPAEEVHHIKHLTPKNITDPEISLNPDNLKSLCSECHKRIHLGDKMDGTKRYHSAKENPCHAEEYVFDENGYLVRKE